MTGIVHKNPRLSLIALFCLAALLAGAQAPVRAQRTQRAIDPRIAQKAAMQGFLGQPKSLAEAKKRLAPLQQGLQVRAGMRVQNMGSARLKAALTCTGAMSTSCVGPAPMRTMSATTSSSSAATPSAITKAATRTLTAPPIPTGKSGASVTLDSQQPPTAAGGSGDRLLSHSKSSYAKVVIMNEGQGPPLDCQWYNDHILRRVDGQTSPAQWIFTPDSNHIKYRLDGCNFGTNLAAVYLRPPGGRTFLPSMNKAITLQIESAGKNSVLVSLDPGLSGYLDTVAEVVVVDKDREWVAAQVQFRAKRVTSVLSGIGTSAANLSPAGQPYLANPMSDFYGLNASVGVARQSASPLIAGQDTISLTLANDFAIEGAQIQYLVYGGGGGTSVSNGTPSQNPTIQGSKIIINWPISSVTLSGQSQPIYYSVYGLNISVSGPVGLDPITGQAKH